MARCFLQSCWEKKSGLDPEMKKFVSEERIRTSACNFGITHVTDRNVCLPVIKKNGENSFLFSGIAGGGVLFFYLVMTGPQVSSLRALLMFFYPHGGRNYRERCGSTYKPGGYSSYLKHISTAVSVRCGIFTFVWCNSWNFIIVSNF